jgi:hypothetical protein
MVDLYCANYYTPPAAVTLDIDDTLDVVHGHQQLALFNAHYDERCFSPIHVYDIAIGRPVAVLLRPGKTPSAKEVRGHLSRLVRRIRWYWPLDLDYDPRRRPLRPPGSDGVVRGKRHRLHFRTARPGREPDQIAQAQLASDRTSCVARWPMRCTRFCTLLAIG